jgi:hypothetical protein
VQKPVTATEWGKVLLWGEFCVGDINGYILAQDDGKE